MATSSFRSTSRRSSAVGAAGSSTRDRSHHRRSRSLSRSSGSFPPPPPSEAEEHPTPRGRFVNKVRGSGFRDVSVDDLADEFFRARVESDDESVSSAEKARSGNDRSRRNSSARYWMETESSRQRGRSVSRAPSDRRHVQGNGGYEGDAIARRRQSVSAVPRRQCSDSENDIDSHSSSTVVTFCHGKVQLLSSYKPKTSGTTLTRSISQKDCTQSQVICSSSSSSLTDDGAKDFRSSKYRVEKSIPTVYAQEKVEHSMRDGQHIELHEVMHKEVRHTVEELRMKLEKVISSDDDVQPNSSQVLEAIAEIRRSYTRKLEQSEKRKKDLLAELAVEEEHEQELCEIVKELLPSRNKSVGRERQINSRRRSNYRTRISKDLTEEAEKYFEDFLTNVEDTDISSFDGERSDTSSSLQGCGFNNPIADNYWSTAKLASLPVDEEVMLPWLQWETSPDPSSSCKIKTVIPLAPSSPIKEATGGSTASSLESWSPQQSSSSVSMCIKEIIFSLENRPSNSSAVKNKYSFDMDEYLNLKNTEDLIFERFRHKQKIDSGSMILCGSLML